MTQEQIEQLQDAWFFLRDNWEETDNTEVKAIMDRLHAVIDAELEAKEVAV